MSSKFKIDCAKCGQVKIVSVNVDSKVNIVDMAKSWGTTGMLLFCPRCAKEKNILTRDDTIKAMLRKYVTQEVGNEN